MKRARSWLALALLCTLALPFGARAQELNFGALDASRPNRAHLRVGAEYGFVAGAGYARALPFLERALVVFGDFTLPWVDLDLSDYRVKTGVLLPIVGRERWKLIGGLAPTLRGTKNEISRMTGLGADALLVGGYYAPHWFAAGELGLDWAITTHVSHTDAYREKVFADAKDGWYRVPGGNLRAGLQGGGSFGRYDVILRAGFVRDIRFEAPLLPFYGSLGFGVRW